MAYWSYFYSRAIANFFGGISGGDDRHVDWLSDAIRVAPLDDSYVPADNHEVYADLTGLVSGTATISSKSVVYTGATKLIEFKGTVGLLDDGARWLVYYDDTHADKPLIGYADLGSNWNAPYTPLTHSQLTSQFQFVVEEYDPAGADVKWYWYGKALANALGGESSGEDRWTDWKSDDVKVAILDDTYTPDQDADEIWSDVSAAEVSGAGYAAGGRSLDTSLSTAIRVHPTIKRTEFCAEAGGAVIWSVVAFTDARYAVLYNATHADEPLLGFVDFRANLSPATEEFRIGLATGYQGQGIQGATPFLQITVS